MAVSEDEPSYVASGCSNTRAKLLLVDQSDYNTQHIFFDDRAVEGEQSIVDVRDVITGEQLPQRKTQDMYVI